MPFGMLRTCIDTYSEARGGELRFLPDEKDAAEIDRQLDDAEKKGAEILAQMKKERGE